MEFRGARPDLDVQHVFVVNFRTILLEIAPQITENATTGDIGILICPAAIRSKRYCLVLTRPAVASPCFPAIESPFSNAPIPDCLGSKCLRTPSNSPSQDCV
jgi:hypothetical protein